MRALRREAPGDWKTPRAVGREHDQLGGRRLDPREREHDGTVRDEHDVAAGRSSPRQLTERAKLLGLARAIVEEIAQRRPWLGRAERQARGLEAATPGARQHARDRDAARPERRPDAARVLPSGVGEDALRRAVVELETGRTADP